MVFRRVTWLRTGHSCCPIRVRSVYYMMLEFSYIPTWDGLAWEGCLVFEIKSWIFLVIGSLCYISVIMDPVTNQGGMVRTCYKCRRGERSLGVVIQAVSEGVILQNERSYLERKYRPYLCFPEALEGPDIDGILEYKAA